jgi:hypothetical protein
LVLAIVVSRIVFYSRFLKVWEQPFAGERWGKAYLLLAFISGIIWGFRFYDFPDGQSRAHIPFCSGDSQLVGGYLWCPIPQLRLGPTVWAAPAMLLYTVRCYQEGFETYTIGLLII